MDGRSNTQKRNSNDDSSTDGTTARFTPTNQTFPDKTKHHSGDRATTLHLQTAAVTLVAATVTTAKTSEISTQQLRVRRDRANDIGATQKKTPTKSCQTVRGDKVTSMSKSCPATTVSFISTASSAGDDVTSLSKSSRFSSRQHCRATIPIASTKP